MWNEELHLCTLHLILSQPLNEKIMRLMKRVESKGNKKCPGIFIGLKIKFEDRSHFGDLGVCGAIILRWVWYYCS
jgi:hypothetical protein